MTEFLDIILSMPTLLFTVPLGLMLAYWVTVIVGGIDIDFLDGGADGAVEGALDGVMDGAVDGALDGVVDGALDGVMDGAVDGVMDGAVDGVMDGAVDGVMDGAVDGAMDGAADAAGDGADFFEPSATFSVLAFVASVLRLGKVPATFALTGFALWAWVSSFLLTWGFRHGFLGTLPAQVFAFGAIAGALVMGGAATNVTMRPFEPVFKRVPARTRNDLLGETCKLTTSRADHGFGQAMLTVDDDVLKVSVRCDRADNGLKRGDEALIVSYDPDRRAYIVEPLLGDDAEDVQQRLAAVRRRAAQAARRGSKGSI